MDACHPAKFSSLTLSPPTSLAADFVQLEVEALTADHIEVNFAQNVGSAVVHLFQALTESAKGKIAYV